ncbi:MAG TPA: hypothetical protein VEZ11_12005 [Thermoanaerobaculia bacterium]|nr:hypothetical protein [Thermoanaerobaculia bacterium]
MARMEALIDGPFARALEKGRDRYNAAVHAAQAASAFDAEALARHLRDIVAPVVDAVAAVDPAALERTTDALFTMSVELIAMALLGPGARRRTIGDAWSRLLPAVPQVLRLDPRRIAGATTNALSTMESFLGDRATAWTDSMLAIAAEIHDIDAFLAAGRVSAWRAGMAHYRIPALDAAMRLPAPIAAGILGCQASEVARVVDAMRRDPWLDPAGDATDRHLAIARRAGGFRGFGGAFITPPRARLTALGFVVNDEDKRWLMTADRFGATLLPLAEQPPEMKVDDAFTIDGKGTVSHAGMTAAFPQLAGSTSAVCDSATLVVTTPCSHLVAIVAVVAT